MLAGAGTGKTAALTARLAHIIATRRAWPSEILAVTFTNKAAREMRERIGRMIGDAVEGMPWLGTFHSIAARMLRRHAELVGLQSNFTILDTDDQLRVLKQLIQAEGLDEKRWPARQLAGLIDKWKNRGLTPAELDAADREAYADGKGQHLYALYQARLKTLNACDFGDLLLHMLVILKTHRDVLEQYQQRFKYILVDEYQDTNASQYLWLRLLAQQRKNICCVGDDDQCLAEGTPVTMADGSTRPIEAIAAERHALVLLRIGRFPSGACDPRCEPPGPHQPDANPYCTGARNHRNGRTCPFRRLHPRGKPAEIFHLPHAEARQRVSTRHLTNPYARTAPTGDWIQAALPSRTGRRGVARGGVRQ